MVQFWSTIPVGNLNRDEINLKFLVPLIFLLFFIPIRFARLIHLVETNRKKKKKRKERVLNNTCSPTLVGSSLGCDHAALVLEWLPDHHLAVLEDHGGVAEDEVDGAGDGAVAVELPVDVGVEGVLVGVDLAVVNDCPVGRYTERHGLVLLSSCAVLKPNVLGHEMISINRCIYIH